MPQGRYEESRKLFQQSIAIHAVAWGADHPYGVDNLEDYAKLLRTTGDDAEAEDVESHGCLDSSVLPDESFPSN